MSGHYYGNDQDTHLANIGAYYDLKHANKYVPRTIMMDLDGSCIDQIRDGDMRDLFNFDTSVTGGGGCENNYARGFYREGHDALEGCMEEVRRHIEKCENFQGF